MSFSGRNDTNRPDDSWQYNPPPPGALSQQPPPGAPPVGYGPGYQQAGPGYQQQAPIGFEPNNPIPLSSLKNPNKSRDEINVSLTQEDLRLLRECNRESFYYRCLPFMALGATALRYYSTQKKQKPPGIGKYIMVLSLGWILGKISYRSVCEDKLATSSSTTPFIERLRKKRGMTIASAPGSLAPESEFLPEQPISDWDRPIEPSTEFGYNPNEPLGSRTRRQPTGSEYGTDFGLQPDNPTGDQPPPVRPSVSYDELRARNRAGIKF